MDNHRHQSNTNGSSSSSNDRQVGGNYNRGRSGQTNSQRGRGSRIDDRNLMPPPALPAHIRDAMNTPQGNYGGGRGGLYNQFQPPQSDQGGGRGGRTTAPRGNRDGGGGGNMAPQGGNRGERSGGPRAPRGNRGRGRGNTMLPQFPPPPPIAHEISGYQDINMPPPPRPAQQGGQSNRPAPRTTNNQMLPPPRPGQQGGNSNNQPRSFTNNMPPPPRPTQIHTQQLQPSQPPPYQGLFQELRDIETAVADQNGVAPPRQHPNGVGHAQQPNGVGHAQQPNGVDRAHQLNGGDHSHQPNGRAHAQPRRRGGRPRRGDYDKQQPNDNQQPRPRAGGINLSFLTTRVPTDVRLEEQNEGTQQPAQPTVLQPANATGNGTAGMTARERLLQRERELRQDYGRSDGLGRIRYDRNGRQAAIRNSWNGEFLEA